MQIDILKTPLENLFLQANADNPELPIALSALNVTVGTPQVRTPDANPRNTTITFTPIADQGYKGNAVVCTYTRLALDKGVAVAPGSVVVLASDDAEAALAKVVTAYGLIASEVTGTNFVAPVNENTPGSITLVADADSLVYFGPDLTVTLTVADADVDLESLMTNPDFNGFDPVE